MNKNSSNNSVLYLFLLSLLVSFGVILVFSKDTNNKSSTAYISDSALLASAYIPVNFEEEFKEKEVKIVKKAPPVAPKKEVKKVSVAKVEKKVEPVIQRAVVAPQQERKRSAVMSYAVTKQPVVIAPRPIVSKPKPQVVYEKPKPAPVKEKPKQNVSNLEKEIRDLAIKKLEKEITESKE